MSPKLKYDVHVGQVGRDAAEANWRERLDRTADDDEELARTPREVVSVLGFDPADEDEVEKYDPNQPRAPAGSPEGGRWTDTGGGTGTGKLSDHFAGGFGLLDPEALRENWDQHFEDMSPQAVIDAMTASLPLAGKPRLEVLYDGTWFQFTFELEDGTLMKRSLTFGGLRAAIHDYLVVPSSKQGKGLAKSILRSQVNLYEKLGIGQVMLNANDEVGGYAWAKYGFLHRSKEEWVSMARGLQKEFPIVPDHIRKLLQSDDRRSLWGLADDPDGKTMLITQMWPGVLDLRSREQMSRFRSYIQ